VSARTRPGSAVAGDGFDALILHERGPMERVAYLICGSGAVAEEVVHDAFVSTYERWDRLDNPGGYLRRSVVNAALRSKARHSHGERLHAVAAGPAAQAAPESYDHTLEAVGRLAPRARALVVLRYYHQLSSEEIAETLGIPIGTVKSGLHRALAQLREVLA
jgi:RNA polymerase sigma factor (sigma-70 family)